MFVGMLALMFDSESIHQNNYTIIISPEDAHKTIHTHFHASDDTQTVLTPRLYHLALSTL